MSCVTSLVEEEIKFLIRPNKKLFIIHLTLITHHLKPLNVLINKNILEVKKKCTLLKEINEHTFI